MTMEDFRPNVDPRLARIQGVLDLYLRSLALVLLALGVWQWAIILGAFPDPWRFEGMLIEWQWVTITLGVADLVAGVGLWLRVAWGTVIWIFAALFEIALHTVFTRTYDQNFPIVAFHSATIVLFLALWIAEFRARHRY